MRGGNSCRFILWDDECDPRLGLRPLQSDLIGPPSYPAALDVNEEISWYCGKRERKRKREQKRERKIERKIERKRGRKRDRERKKEREKERKREHKIELSEAKLCVY